MDSQIQFFIGVCEMMLPKTISGWCMWLFFLCFGLGYFLSSMTFFGLLAAVFALVYAVAALFGM